MNKRSFVKTLLAGGAAGVTAVKSVESFEVKPDQVLVVKVKGTITEEVAYGIKRLVEDKLPGQKVMVIDDQIDLSVVNLHKA